MRPLALTLLCLALAACDSDPTPAADARSVEVLTDKRVYRRAFGETDIEVSVANTSDRVLYLESPSFDTVLDVREGGDWVEVGPWYGANAFGLPTRFEPGTYRTWSGLVTSEPTTLVPGEYRIRTKVYEDEALERLLPEAELVSAPFEIIFE